jgi:branched-chain amino acid transport system substrate-binding protein
MNTDEKGLEPSRPDGLDSAQGYSRRHFLKVAGLAGAALATGSAVSAVVAACGGGTTTSSSAAQTTTTGGPTTSATQAVVTTTTAAGPEAGPEIKVGFVSALTGSMAAFGKPDRYLVDRWKEVIADGLVCGDGKKHPVSVNIQDAQSNSNRASQVAGDLIENQKCQIMMAACTGDIAVPVADTCEALGTPSFTTDAIWQAWFNTRKGDPKVGFKWTYHAFFATDDSFVMYFDMWNKVPNNKTYGALWPNDIDGNTYRKLWPAAIEKQGWKLVDPGDFPDGNEDFTAIIDKFKKGGAEVCAGLMAPPDFTTFWKQATQQGYKPKICSIGKALNFPQAVTALGDISIGLTAPIYWAPTFPYKSSLTGETAQQLADDYEKRTGQQWSQALNHYICFEVVVDTLKRAKDPTSKESIVAALKVTKIASIEGPIDFTAPIQAGTVHPNINCCRMPLVGGQWVKGKKWPYDVLIVANKQFEDIPLGGQMKSLTT